MGYLYRRDKMYYNEIIAGMIAYPKQMFWQGSESLSGRENETMKR